MVNNKGKSLVSVKKPSWGVSRSAMNPIFVDQINHAEFKEENTPAPGHSHNDLEWVHNSQRHSVKDKAGPIYGVTGRDHHLNKHLLKTGK